MGFIAIAKIAGLLALKAFDLHASGADVKIIEEVEGAISQAQRLFGHPQKRLLSFHTLGHVAGAIFLKAFDLHESGEDTTIVDEVHGLLSEVHDILRSA